MTAADIVKSEGGNPMQMNDTYDREIQIPLWARKISPDHCCMILISTISKLDPSLNIQKEPLLHRLLFLSI
jgi:hypothetical protein